MKNTEEINDLKSKLILKQKELTKLEVKFFQKKVSEKYRNKERNNLLEEIDELRSKIDSLQASTSTEPIQFEDLYIF